MREIKMDPASQFRFVPRRLKKNWLFVLLFAFDLIFSAWPARATLLEAVQSGQLSQVQFYLDGNGESANLTDQYGTSLLQIAAGMGYLDIVSLLLERGALLHEREDLFSSTALEFAIFNHHLAVARLLIARGANLHEIRTIGMTYLDQVLLTGNHSAFQTLSQLNGNSDSTVYDFSEFVEFSQSIASYGWIETLPEIYALYLKLKNKGFQWYKMALHQFKKTGDHFILFQESLDEQLFSDRFMMFIVDLNGQIIVRYNEKNIGIGGHKKVKTCFGIFWDQKRLGRVTPLVELTPLNDEEIPEFLFEIQTHLQIEDYLEAHPRAGGRVSLGIAPLVLSGAESEIPFMILPRFDWNLNELLKSQSLNPELRQVVLLKIARGLGNLHQAGFVHGDLKEENVLMKKNGEVGIADFGLTYNPKDDIINLTSAIYEAPEMLERPTKRASTLEEVGQFQKRDIFSFGILALHTLKGEERESLWERCKHYFSDKNQRSPEYNRCITEQAPKLYARAVENAEANCSPEIPKKSCIHQIIADCLNPNPDLRPSSQLLISRLHQALLLF